MPENTSVPNIAMLPVMFCTVDVWVSARTTSDTVLSSFGATVNVSLPSTAPLVPNRKQLTDIDVPLIELSITRAERSLPMPGFVPLPSITNGRIAAEDRAPSEQPWNWKCWFTLVVPLNPPTRWNCVPSTAPAVLSTPVVPGTADACDQVLVAGS